MSNADREFLTPARAKELLGDKSEVHVLLNPNAGMLIGADWTRAEIDRMLDAAETIEVGGEECKRMKHGLVVALKGRYHFLECEALNATDTGEG